MARMMRATRKRLGEILVEGSVITEQRLVDALKEQRRTGELLGEALVRMKLATEEHIASTVAVQCGHPYLPVKEYEISKEMKDIFPPLLLRQYQFVPIEKMGNVLAVVAGGYITEEILRELEQFVRMTIKVYVGKQSEVRELIRTDFAPETAGEKAEVVQPWLQDESARGRVDARSRPPAVAAPRS